MKTRLLQLTFLLLPFFGTSQTVVDVIVNSDDHNTLETAVLAAGLETTLSGAGPFTVFAPTDDAFAAVDSATLAGLLNDPMGALTDVLTYHVAAANAPSSSLSDGQMVTTVNGADVTITISNGIVFVNGAQVTMADVPATNGVVHVIDAVLLPPAPPAGTVVDVIVNSDDHNTLETAVLAAGLETTLAGAGPFTVFAPTDDAFAAVDSATLAGLLNDPMGALTDVLTYHVAPTNAPSSSLSDGQMVTTVNGADVTITISNGIVFVNGAQVTMADVPATNGVVHVINAVLLPPVELPSIFEIVEGSAVHNTLEALLIQTGLDAPLNDESLDVTLFAPTDEAITALGQETIDQILADTVLASIILNHHVTAGTQLSTSLSNRQVIEMGFFLDELITIENGNVFIGNAQISGFDLEASNGVVHVIDAVLLPSTVAGTISQSPDFSTLNAVLEASQLDDLLSSREDRFTLFAPTNDAFAALGQDVIDELLMDPTGDLANILSRHVTSSRIFSNELSDEQVVTMANGEDVTIRIENGNAFINNAQITGFDFFTGNGNIHIVNAVITPEDDIPATVVDIIVNSDVHNTLEAVVIQAGLVPTLQGEGPFTVFAPTDDAFAAVDSAVLAAIVADNDILTRVLTYHVIGDSIPSSALTDGQTATTVEGSDITVTSDGTNFFINGALVTLADLPAKNGIVHVINAVLLPPGILSTQEVDVNDVMIAPNPVNEEFTITISDNLFDNPTYQLIDNTGKVIKQFFNVTSGQSLNVGEVPAGMYHLIIADKNFRSIERLIKL